MFLADRDPAIEIEQMSEAAVFGLIARVADWYRATDETSVDTIPLKEAARDMLAYIDPSLPQLHAGHPHAGVRVRRLADRHTGLSPKRSGLGGC